MPGKKVPQNDSAELRRLAEDRLRENRGTAPPRTEAESQRLLHELEVHQIELEMQNEELSRAKDEMETLAEKYRDLYDFAPVGYFTLDRVGTIRSVNLTGTGLLGIERSRLIGIRFRFFVADEARPAFTDFLGKVFTGLTKETCEVALFKEGNDQLCVQVEGKAAASGQECCIALIDITERKWAEEVAKEAADAVRKSEEQLRLLIDGAKDYAIIMLDVNGHVSSWNDGAKRIQGWDAQEILGRHFSLFQTEELVAAGQPEHELEIARTEGRYAEEGWRLRKDGSKFLADVIITAIRDEYGALRGFSKVTRDITERKQLEKEREMFAHRIKTLEGIIPICMYCKKIRDDQNIWNQLEQYITDHTEAMFSHGMCPQCAEIQFKIIRDRH